MRGAWRLLLLVGGAAVVVALFFALRGGDGEDGAQPPPPPPPATTSAETRPRPRPPQPIVVRIAVRGGTTPVRRVTIPQNRQVVLAVTSDVADEVHLHGYDLKRDVAPGRPARIVFRARIPGRFEVELEERHVQIALLTVRP